MTNPPLGVVIVTFNSADVILPCLESLLAAGESDGVRLCVTIVDNASTDGTVDLINAWATCRAGWISPDDLPFVLCRIAGPVLPSKTDDPAAPLTVLQTGVNGGFAAGVNRGIAHLHRNPELERFWILNPDCVVPPGTAGAFARHPGGFSLLGGRVVYFGASKLIQMDGGRINWRTGTTSNVNQYRKPAETPPPDPAAMDFISGASMVASRAFIDAAGPMAEDYFLYYEEVDWALCRGDLPLAYCPGGIVYHRAGTSIGSPAPGRPASPFSLYFKYRARMRFLYRHKGRTLPGAWGFTFAKITQSLLHGHRDEAAAMLAGARDAEPPQQVRARLCPAAAALAFAPKR